MNKFLFLRFSSEETVSNFGEWLIRPRFLGNIKSWAPVGWEIHRVKYTCTHTRMGKQYIKFRSRKSGRSYAKSCKIQIQKLWQLCMPKPQNHYARFTCGKICNYTMACKIRWRLDPPDRHKPKTQEGALSTRPACGMSPASNVGQCVTTSAAGRLGINRLEMSSLNQGNCHMKKNKQNCEKPNQLMEDFMLPVANWKYIQSNWRRPKCNEQVENGKNWI